MPLHLNMPYDVLVGSMQLIPCGKLLQIGNTFTIEPMINMGNWRDTIWPDGWTAVTNDGKRSAQFEHTLVVTKNGCDVLTKRSADSPPLWWEVEGVELNI